MTPFDLYAAASIRLHQGMRDFTIAALSPAQARMPVKAQVRQLKAMTERLETVFIAAGRQFVGATYAWTSPTTGVLTLSGP